MSEPPFVPSGHCVAEPTEAAEHLRRANTRLALLNEIVTGLGVSTGRERTTRAVIERLAGALDGVRVGFSTVSADGTIESRLSATSATGGPGAESTVGASPAPAAEYHPALRRQELLRVPDVRRDPLLEASSERLEADGVRALLAVGFPRSEELTDVLSFESPVPRAWSEEDASVLLEVAAYLFLTLQEAGYQEERERAFAIQARTASRLTTLVESIQVGVLEEDEDRNISLVNQAFCDMFHLPPPEQLIGKPTRETLRSTRDLMVDPEGFIAGVDERIRDRERVIDEEVELLDGRILERDYLPGTGREEFGGHFWVFRDITAHKRTAEAARRSAERYRDFVENGVALAWSHDLEGRMLSANRSLAAAIGAASPEELIGGSIPDVVDPGYGLSWDRYIAGIRETGVARGRFRMVCADGTKRVLAFSNVLRTDEDGRPVVRGFGENVTQHAEAEEALSEANRALAAANRVLEETQRKMELLNEIGELLLTAREVGEAGSVLRTFLPRMFEGYSGSAHLRSREGDEGFEPVVAWGAAPPSAEPLAIDDCWALRRSRLHRAGGACAGPSCAHVEERRRGSVQSLCVPLQANGNLLGLLHLQRGPVRLAPGPGAGESGLDDLRQVAINTAEQISLGLWNLQLRESLRTQALEDPLTGLRNRRYLEERLRDELRRAERVSSPLAVLMVDLDRFKRVNDLYGHPTGDRLLVRVARFLEGAVRAEDVVARYGGEEFVVVLSGTGEDDARWTAEKLCKSARRLGAQLVGEAREARISLSIGVAVHPEHGATVNDLLGAADGALYRAKGDGRDRVVTASDLALPAALDEAG